MFPVLASIQSHPTTPLLSLPEKLISGPNMSQVEETPIMLQAKYRVKTLMKEVLTRFGKNEAFMRKSILWKDLQKLHDLLHNVQSYIGDCGRRNKIKLMEEIEEKVHLAADFLEEVPFRAIIDGAKNELGRETDAPMFDVRRKLSRPPSSSSQTPETKSPSEKLEEINSSLKNWIDQISKEYKLEKGVIHGSDLSSPQFELKKPRCSTQEEVEMIGRSEELKQLINVLLEPAKNEEAPLQTIPISGQEGIGKTTLAWAAYDHKQIKDHFDLRVWVSASVSIEAKWVSGKILEALAPNWRAELDSVDEILAVLLKELGGKSFFLVLDDVTGTEATLPRLKLLKDCLLRLNTTRRNKIVITTSSNEVAKEMDMHSQFHLQKLSDDHCKAIFQKEVSGGIQMKDIENLVTLAGGIPLAAKVLGSTVKNSNAGVESGINHPLQDDIFTKQEEDWPTFFALKLSYLRHLPPDAQLCFAYMSMFPPNTPIEKGNVIQLWIAHGFFQSHHPSLEMEDIGKACLKILLNSCLIEPAERDSYGYISSVRLARIAWELASQLLLRSTEKHVSNYSGLQLVQASESPKLHTFFSVGNNDVSYGSYDFGSLRVLNLSRSQFKKWPVAFDKLIHLRYLDVSGTKVAELPESISKLIYIQTIRAINCSYLERLPKDLSNLEELRHFCIDADNEAIRKGNMPLGLGTLTCLQTLPLLVVSKDDPHISVEVLGPLKNLRGKLTVCNLEHLTPEEAEGWKLMEKARIDELQFEWSMSNEQRDNDTKVLEKLQPNANLKSLTLQNFAGNKITMWKSQAGADTALILKNLMMLKLSNCSKCKKLPTLGTLPCLTELHIEGMDNLEDIDPEFYTTGTASADESKSKLFPALRKFTLMYLAKLKSWSKADNEVFPLLEELRVEGCDDLVSTPSHFQSLKRLHVESVNSREPLANICSNIASLTSVHISSVLNLQSLPEGILRNNPNLSSLLIWNCPDLTQIPKPDTWSCSSSLRSLSINECEKLENLPENLNNASSLTELIISQCNSLKSIPSVDGLCSLRRLKFEWCSGLESLPSGLQSCTSLEHLTIKGCPSLISVQDEGLTNLTSLCSVNIIGCEKLTALPLRELLHYLIKLRRLEIEGFTEDHPLGLTIEYPGLTGWARFKALPKPFQTQKIKRAWTIDPKLIETFATKAVGFLEAMQLFETGVKEITR